MITIIARIFKYGFQNFWRNVWPSAATVLVMVMALLMVAGLALFNVVTKAAVSSIEEKIDVSVYFTTTTAEDDILAVKQSLESFPEVKSVEYISRDKALEIFKAKHADDPTIVQTVNELSENPLEASLNISAQNPDQYPAIAEYLKAPNLKEHVSKVTYYENREVIDRLIKIVGTVNTGGLLLTIILAVIAGLVVFNTVQLAIYSSRDEIGIMRAVGASNALVRGPFVVEGVIAGLIAAIVSLIVAAPVIYTISPYLDSFIPGLNLFAYFTASLFGFILLQLGVGIAIGALSSFVAVRRYLRN
jgi:cell division transport system permease protein